jgi:hypothetical protein
MKSINKSGSQLKSKEKEELQEIEILYPEFLKLIQDIIFLLSPDRLILIILSLNNHLQWKQTPSTISNGKIWVT